MSEYFRDRFQGAGAIAAAAPAPRSAPAPMVGRRAMGALPLLASARVLAKKRIVSRAAGSVLGTGGQRPPLSVPPSPGSSWQPPFTSGGGSGLTKPPRPTTPRPPRPLPPAPPQPLPLPRPPTTAPPIAPSPATPSPITQIGTSSTTPSVVVDPFDEQDLPLVPSPPIAPSAASSGITGKQIAIGVGILAAAYYLFKKH